MQAREAVGADFGALPDGRRDVVQAHRTLQQREHLLHLHVAEVHAQVHGEGEGGGGGGGDAVVIDKTTVGRIIHSMQQQQQRTVTTIFLFLL